MSALGRFDRFATHRLIRSPTHQKRKCPQLAEEVGDFGLPGALVVVQPLDELLLLQPPHVVLLVQTLRQVLSIAIDGDLESF